MGLYDDIQVDVKEALLTDLNDAYLDFSVTAINSTSYDAETGQVVNDSVIESFKGVRTKFVEGIDLDLPETTIALEVLVLDSDKPFAFEENQTITHLAKDYNIVSIDVDPANATWILGCSKNV